jgi:acyl dehydratase
VGDTKEVVLVEELTRSQIVQYAGASGDFNPLHTDERFATEAAGEPSVFAHGMLTMAMVGTVLTDWFGPGRLRTFDGRFLNRVWPGDRLVARAVVDSIELHDQERIASVGFEVTNQERAVVFAGRSDVRVD